MSETVYFITGASRGIGLEFIHQLVKREKSVVYAGVRNPASLEKHFPSPRPDNLHIVPCDVISDESVQAAASIVSEKSGRVDVLINNAGIDNGLSIRETMIRAFLPLISKSSIKKIINISSDFGSVALNDRTFAGAYNISKAALNMLTVQYKNEYAEEGIIFIPLHPGDVFTDMNVYDAKIPTSESVEGMMGVIDRVKIEDSGKYLTNEGGTLPW